MMQNMDSVILLTKKYIEGGLENENFIAYGYEDDESTLDFIN